MGKLYRDLVRTHSKAKGSARALLNVLADYADDDGMAWPSRATLANDTGLSERTVTRCLQTLCGEGRLSIEENAVGGRGRVPVYKIQFPELEKGDKLSEQRTPDCHPLDAERVTNARKKGDKLSKKGDKFAANQSYARFEPQLTNTTEPEKGIAANAAPPAPAESPKPTKPKRSRKSQTPPPSEAPPKEPSEWQEFVGALCWLCHGHMDVGSLTETKRGALLSEAKEIHANEYSKEDLREWYKRIWPQSWQWQKNKSRPNPADVRSTIAQLRATTPEGFEEPVVLNGYHANGTSKVAASLAAIDEYEQLLAAHGVSR